MQKFWELFDKYSTLVITFAAAYWAVVGLFGYDLLGLILSELHLYFILRLVYLAIGAAAIYKLLEKFKPDVIKNIRK